MGRAGNSKATGRWDRQEMTRAIRQCATSGTVRPALIGAALTLVVALVGIARPSVWFDEAATISAVDRGFGSYVELISAVDAVHGLYYLVMMPWVQVFGISALSIRAPSALVLAACAFFTVKLTMHYTGKVDRVRAVRAGWAAALLVAVLPGLTWMGQDARGYPFGTTCVVLGLWCYERWLSTRDDRWLGAFVVAHTVGIYFVLYAAMLVPLYVVRSFWLHRGAAARTFAAALAIGAATLPLVFAALPQQGQVSWIGNTVSDVMRRVATNQFFMGQHNNEAPWFETLKVMSWALFALTVVIIVVGRRERGARSSRIWLLSWILFPVAILVGLQMAGGQFYDERYLAFTGPVLVVLIAMSVTLNRLPQSVGLIALTVMVLACLPAVAAQHGEAAKFRFNYQAAATFLGSADTIYFLDPSARGIPLAYPKLVVAREPLLEFTPAESGTLWGVSRPIDTVFDEKPSGSVAIVDYRSGRYDGVVAHFVSIGCTPLDTYDDTRHRAILLRC